MNETHARVMAAVAAALVAGVALANEAFHPCVVRGRTQPGAWVVSNCGQIAEGDVRMLVGKTLYSLYASLPPTWRVKSEADAKRHFHLFMKMLGANVQAEEASAFGYADAIVETKMAVYVFEFKFNKSVKAAIRQIREKGYADAYKGGKRPVTLIGINFSSKKRNIDEPLIEA